MNFEELTRKQPKTEVEQTLVQCIVSLSCHPTFSSWNMESIYDDQVKRAKEVGY